MKGMERVVGVWIGLLMPALGLEDWPEFRGPTGQGIAAREGPREWGKEKGVTWKVKVAGTGWSSPVIADGKIVLTMAKGEGANVTLAAAAYDRETGKAIWERDLFEPDEQELAALHAKNSLASSTPIISEGVAYVHFGHMGTAALGMGDGEVRWKTKLKYKPMHGSGSSLVKDGGRLFFNADGEENPTVVAMDATNGEILWRVKRNRDVRQLFSFSTPLVVDNGGRREVISPGSGMVGAYAPEDGSLIWKVEYDAGFSVVPRPVTMDGKVYFSTSFMKPVVMAIRLEGAEGDVTDSHVVWTVKKQMPKVPCLIAHEGKVISLDDTGRMNCLDAASGEPMWKKNLMGNFSASPVLAGGKLLYCLTEDGVCYLLEVSRESAEVVLEVDLEERLFASPAVVDGELFLRSEGHLWRITGVEK